MLFLTLFLPKYPKKVPVKSQRNDALLCLFAVSSYSFVLPEYFALKSNYKCCTVVLSCTQLYNCALHMDVLHEVQWAHYSNCQKNMFKEKLLFNNSMPLYTVMYTFWLDKFGQLVHMHKEKYPSKTIMIHSVQTRAKWNLTD